MTAALLDGHAAAEMLLAEVADGAARFAQQHGRQPRLVAVQVGDSPSAQLYADMQARSADRVGIAYEYRALPDSTPESELAAHLAMLNADTNVDAIILQMPLPDAIDARRMQSAIGADKDAEGIHPTNLGKLFFGTRDLVPCTPASVLHLLESTGEDLAGREAVVIGHSEIVGKPIAMLLLASRRSSPTVTVCHVATRNLAEHTRRADVLIVAAGVSQARWRGWWAIHKNAEQPTDVPPHLTPLITANMVKPGAIIIDVATNRIPRGFDDAGRPLRKDNGKLDIVTVGDVDFDPVREIASHITPVPGGVGPLTVAMLLRNTLRCAERS